MHRAGVTHPARQLVPRQAADSSRGAAREIVAPSSRLALTRLEGEPGRVIAAGSFNGSSSASVCSMQLRRGARVSGCLADLRVSFNLTGSLGRSCEWGFAGRRRRHAVEVGALYLCPPGLDFQVATDVDTHVLAAQLPSDLIGLALGELGVSVGSVMERVASSDRKLLDLTLALRSEVLSDHQNGPLYWSEISHALALRVVECHSSRGARLPASVLSGVAIREINEMIWNKMESDITLDDLARVAGYSRFHFLRTFRKTVGMTPSRYVMHRRLQAAISLAKYSRSTLASIAYSTGFADQSHLIRWAKQVHGMQFSKIRSI
jgi:AraC family transcriptional regulator